MPHWQVYSRKLSRLGEGAVSAARWSHSHDRCAQLGLGGPAVLRVAEKRDQWAHAWSERVNYQARRPVNSRIGVTVISWGEEELSRNLPIDVQVLQALAT